MPRQEQQPMAGFAKKLGGGRIAAANAATAGKPIDLGGRKQLPAGIKNGIARLSSMYTKEQDKEDSSTCPKGEVFFRASAIALTPKEYDGAVTSIIIPLCNVPARGKKDAVSFEENWNQFRSLFEALGVPRFPEPDIDPKVDPAGAEAQGLRIEAYFMAAMRGLTDPVRMKTNPIFISYSTTGWKPTPTPDRPHPEEIVYHHWSGLADMTKFDATVDPAAAMQDNIAASQPAPNTPPPTPNQNGQHQPSAAPPTPAPTEEDLVDTVSALIESAMNDPNGTTPEGVEAARQLQQMAWGVGWTEEQTAKADDWAEVGNMILNPPVAAATAPPAAATPSTNGAPGVTVGSRWGFCKRGKDGSKLKDGAGKEFPPQEVEVTSVDNAAKTATLKNVKDGKDITDLRSKKPVQARWEWLEAQPLPY